MAAARPNGNSPLVVRYAMRYRDQLPPGLSWQDLLQEGEIGLAQAMGRFNPDRGVPLEKFAEARIVGCLRAAIAAASFNPLGMAFSLDPDDMRDRRDSEEDNRLADDLWDAVDRLDSFGREAVIRRFGLDGCSKETEEVTAWNMGVSPKTIRGAVRRAKAALASVLIA